MRTIPGEVLSFAVVAARSEPERLSRVHRAAPGQLADRTAERNRLSGYGGLVEHGARAHDHALHGNHLAGAHQDDIAGPIASRERTGWLAKSTIVARLRSRSRVTDDREFALMQIITGGADSRIRRRALAPRKLTASIELDQGDTGGFRLSNGWRHWRKS
jgi:hypothetical protein